MDDLVLVQHLESLEALARDLRSTVCVRGEGAWVTESVGEEASEKRGTVSRVQRGMADWASFS